MSYKDEQIMGKREYDKIVGHFQSPKSGKLKGRTEHTYAEDSFKDHKYAKKFGGMSYRGKLESSKNVLDLRKKIANKMGK